MSRLKQSIAALALAASISITPSLAQSADLLVAVKPYVGQHERANRKSLRRMLGVDPVITKWCGALLSAVARKSGYKVPAAGNQAASWRSFGTGVKLKHARKGDVVVMRGHVTIFTRFAKGKVCGIGGNQKNSVIESCYPQGRVVAVRRPVKR